jgi:hypothetical protein
MGDLRDDGNVESLPRLKILSIYIPNHCVVVDTKWILPGGLGYRDP